MVPVKLGPGNKHSIQLNDALQDSVELDDAWLPRQPQDWPTHERHAVDAPGFRGAAAPRSFKNTIDVLLDASHALPWADRLRHKLSFVPSLFRAEGLRGPEGFFKPRARLQTFLIV